MYHQRFKFLLLLIILNMFLLCLCVEANYNEAESLLEYFSRVISNKNMEELEVIISNDELKNATKNFLYNVDEIKVFRIKLVNSEKITNSKIKLFTKLNIKYKNGLNTISLTNINSYFLINADTNKTLKIEDTNIFNELQIPANNDKFFILFLIHFIIIIPFIIYLTFFNFKLKQKMKSLWILSALFFSIIGIVFFYLIFIKKSKYDNR